MTTTTETPEESLARIQEGYSKNDEYVIRDFFDRGIDPAKINPRSNVLTFNAWKAKGRRVAKGAISCKITTWIPTSKGKKDESAAVPTEGTDAPKKHGKTRPKTAFVFHISQTLPKDAPKGTRPDAWKNEELFREGTYEPVEEIKSDDSTNDAVNPCRSLVCA